MPPSSRQRREERQLVFRRCRRWRRLGWPRCRALGRVLPRSPVGRRARRSRLRASPPRDPGQGDEFASRPTTLAHIDLGRDPYPLLRRPHHRLGQVTSRAGPWREHPAAMALGCHRQSTNLPPHSYRLPMEPLPDSLRRGTGPRRVPWHGQDGLRPLPSRHRVRRVAWRPGQCGSSMAPAAATTRCLHQARKSGKSPL